MINFKFEKVDKPEEHLQSTIGYKYLRIADKHIIKEFHLILDLSEKKVIYDYELIIIGWDDPSDLNVIQMDMDDFMEQLSYGLYKLIEG